MPKFNEFIKGFEEKPEAKNPKMEEPKPQPKTKEEQPKKEETFVKNKQGQWVLGKEEEPKAPKYKLSSYFGKNYSGLESSQELDDDIENAIWDKTMKGNFVEVEEPETGKKWRFSPDIGDPYDIALDERFEYGRPAPKAEEPKGKEQVQPKPNKQEEPNSLEYEGYRLEQTPDGKWINRDTYEYFDSKVEAQKDIDKFISSQSPNKPKEAPKSDEKGQRIVNYGGKDMTLEEAKEQYKKAVAIPTLKSTPEREAYLDKSAEYDISQDELYKRWYEEKDPQKKAELKEQMDTLDKEYARFLNEWEEAERNRYKKD